MNRPNYQHYTNKRPHSNQVHQPVKHQRINHVEHISEDRTLQDYSEETKSDDAIHDQTLFDYTNAQETIEPHEYSQNYDNDVLEEQGEHLDEVHFLV